MKIGPCGFEFDMHLHHARVRERIVRRHVLSVFLATNKPEAQKVFLWAVAILGGEWGLWVPGAHGIHGVHGGQSGNGPRGAMGTWVLGPRPPWDALDAVCEYCCENCCENWCEN